VRRAGALLTFHDSAQKPAGVAVPPSRTIGVDELRSSQEVVMASHGEGFGRARRPGHAAMPRRLAVMRPRPTGLRGEFDLEEIVFSRAHEEIVSKIHNPRKPEL
jgi:hypothetical protein